MTTWASYLGNLRIELNDTSEAYYWSSAELLLYFNQGLDEYSLSFPAEATESITPVADTKAYDLPTALLRPVTDYIISVEYPEYKYLKFVEWKPGTARAMENWLSESISFSGGMCYLIWRDQLILSENPKDFDDSIVVRYTGLHTHMAEDTDTLTIPQSDESLLAWFVTAKAHARVSGQDARLSRWKEEGRRNDSPLIPEFAWRMKQFRDGVLRRLKPEHKRLYRSR